MPANQAAKALFAAEDFWAPTVSSDERKRRLSAIDPGFKALAPQEQDRALELTRKKYRPQKETATGAAMHDLSIGWRGSLAHLSQTGANLANLIPTKTTRDVGKSLHQYAEKEAPKPNELMSRQGLASQIFQGLGAAPLGAVEYAPAIVTGSPKVAAAIGALGEADKGWRAAVGEGLKQGVAFKIGTKAGNLPTRTARAIGTGALMGGTTLLETRGDLKKATASALLGGAMGAVGSPKAKEGIPEHGSLPRLNPRETKIGALKDDLKRVFLPYARGPRAAQTAQIISHRAAELAQKSDRVEWALRGARDIFDRLPLDKTNPGGIHPAALDFIDKIERGDLNGVNRKLMPYAVALRDAFDERRKILEKRGLMTTFVENYFPHLWKLPGEAERVYQALGKRPLEGSKGFMKQRKILTIKDGIEYAKQQYREEVAKGNKDAQYILEPISTNPIDLALLKAREMDRFIMAKDVLEEMGSSGLVKLIKSGERLDPGWAFIDDRTAKVMTRIEIPRKKAPKPGETPKPPRTELVQVGQYAAPQEAAQVLNNYLSPGLREKPWFRGWLAMGNSLNQFQLGFSAFHLGFTTYDAAVSQFALGLEKAVYAVQKRDPKIGKEAIKALAKTATVPFEPLIYPISKGKFNALSNQIMEEWHKPGTHPQAAPIVEQMKLAGARIHQDPFYRNDAVRKFLIAKNRADAVGAALHISPALSEKASNWLFEYTVPMQKIGAFHRLAEWELRKLGPMASAAEKRAAFQSAWRSVDNRMGQLVYDNLFWNKTAKDLLMANVRSVGWNLGTVREVGGGSVDTIRAFQAMLKREPVEVTRRMAYVTSLLTLTGLIGGLTNYLMTGEHPHGLDYWFPRTGEKDENGRPKRIQYPTYLRDIAAVTPRPGGVEEYPQQLKRTITGKMHPFVTALADMIENKDWQNQQVVDWEHNDVTRDLWQLGQFALKQYTPYSSRYSIADYLRTTKLGGEHAPKYTVAEGARAFVGVTPAPSDLDKSPFDRAVERLNRQQYSGSTQRTAKQADASQRLREIENAYRQGKAEEARSLIDAGKRRGEITDRQIGMRKKMATQTATLNSFKRLSYDKALQAFPYVYQGGNAMEVEQAFEILKAKVIHKWGDIMALPPDDAHRQWVLEQLRQIDLLTSKGELRQ